MSIETIQQGKISLRLEKLRIILAQVQAPPELLRHWFAVADYGLLKVAKQLTNVFDLFL